MDGARQANPAHWKNFFESAPEFQPAGRQSDTGSTMRLPGRSATLHDDRRRIAPACVGDLPARH
jgi:hypothetical protein